MKRKIALFSIILIFVLNLSPVSANETEDRAAVYIREILSYKLQESNTDSIQTWIDTYLADNAGSGSEWYIISLSKIGDFLSRQYDFSKYYESLRRKLASADYMGNVDKQRCALALASIGYRDDYTDRVVDETTGKQGVMSWVFGLNLVNCGLPSANHTESSLVTEILSRQLSDGGWAIFGQYSDVDVTAMAIQSLTKYYNEDALVRESIDRALDFLSLSQLDNGGYKSYGVDNPESAAQVITALTFLGIDCAESEDFIKNGIDLFDTIERFQLDGGGFCHLAGGGYNNIATYQVLLTSVEYMMAFAPEEILPSAEPEVTPGATPGATPEATPQVTESPTKTTEGPPTPMPKKEGSNISFVIKGAILGALLLLGVGISVFWGIKSRLNLQNILVLWGIIVVLSIVVLTLDIQTKEDYYQYETKDEAVGTVTFSIDCSSALGKTDNKFLPEGGYILPETVMEIEEGDTALSILEDAAKWFSIQLEAENGYVSGINYLYEFDCGELSGWMIFVNGESLNEGAGQYALKDGDIVQWKYTCEIGNDLS